MSVLAGLCVAFLVSAVADASEHTSRFELSLAFVRQWANQPVGELVVILGCAGPVHKPADDCEFHLSGELADPAISDYMGVVLEPPNVCKEASPQAWRTVLKPYEQHQCVGRGFIRVWPEHLTAGQGCSNPAHFMEIHPLLALECDGTQVLDFTSRLKAYRDLGYKSPSVVAKMLALQLWVCEGCSPSAGESDDARPLAFDYCFGPSCTRGAASNFARLKARILTTTIRPAPGRTLPGFATALARVSAIDGGGRESSGRSQLVKLYAADGTAFCTTLLALREQEESVPPLDLLGIFAVDPFSILKVVERSSFPRGDWIPVPYPVAILVFGEY
jgi:hypothetical protein